MNFELKRLFTSLFFIISIILTVYLCNYAWDNNPACAFHCNNTTDWDGFALFTISTFAISTIPALYLASIFYFIFRTLLALWRIPANR